MKMMRQRITRDVAHEHEMRARLAIVVERCLSLMNVAGSSGRASG